MLFCASHRAGSSPGCQIEALERRQLLSVVMGLSGGKQLLFFQTGAPQDILAKLKVKGLERREKLIDIDAKPQSRAVLGYTNFARVYEIDRATGQATPLGPAPTDPAPTDLSLGIAIDPVTGNMRLVGSSGFNAAVDPLTSNLIDGSPDPGTQPDAALSYDVGDVNFGREPFLTTVAYANNVDGATATTLFGIDALRGTLVRIGSLDGTPDGPELGKVRTVGSLFVPVGQSSGMDIETVGDNGDAEDVVYLSTGSTRENSSFYQVDPDTGAATLLGTVGGPRKPLDGIAVLPSGNLGVALDARNRLAVFDTNLPGAVVSNLKVVGMERKERVVAIDFHPIDGQLYGFTNQARIYRVLGDGTVAPVGGEFDVPLGKRDSVAFDIDPVSGQYRVGTDAGLHFRVDPATNAILDTDPFTPGVQIDPSFFYSGSTPVTIGPRIGGVSFGDGGPGNASNVLWGIDLGQNALVTIGSLDGSVSPNTGQVVTQSFVTNNPLGFFGFDYFDGRGYLAGRSASDRGLFEIDPQTGEITFVGPIGKRSNPIGVAVRNQAN